MLIAETAENNNYSINFTWGILDICINKYIFLNYFHARLVLCKKKLFIKIYYAHYIFLPLMFLKTHLTLNVEYSSICQLLF